MPNRVIISNSTVIIAFSILEKLNILKELYGEIILAQEVYNELTNGLNKPGSEITELDWIKVKSVSNIVLIEYLSFNVHKGEAETIAIAEEINADLILLDDFWARRFAKFRGLKITGTIGILIKAGKNGLIQELKPLLDKLILNNFRISPELYKEALLIFDEI